MQKKFISILKQEPNSNNKLINVNRFQAKAIFYAKKINIRGMHQSPKPMDSVFLALPNDGLCMAFDFGAIVLFNVETEDEASVFEHFAPFAQRLAEPMLREEIQISVQPNYVEGFVNGILHIKKASREHFVIIAEVLAKSIVLDHFENAVSESFDKVEPIALNLRNTGRLGHTSTELLKHIGSSLFTEHEMVGNIELTEKPIVLWEHTDLEPLYAQLIEEFEILDRHRIIDNKIDLLGRTAQTSLEVLQHRHASRLEWYIILLICASIMLEIYDIFFSHHLPF